MYMRLPICDICYNGDGGIKIARTRYSPDNGGNWYHCCGKCKKLVKANKDNIIVKEELE